MSTLGPAAIHRDDALQPVATPLQTVGVIFMAANAEQGLGSLSAAAFAAATRRAK
jgi:hypothetical protein